MSWGNYAAADDLNDSSEEIESRNDIEWAKAAGTRQQMRWLIQFVKTTPGYQSGLRQRMNADLDAAYIRAFEEELVGNGMSPSLRPRLPGEKGYGAMDPKNKLMLVLMGLAGAAYVVYFFASV